MIAKTSKRTASLPRPEGTGPMAPAPTPSPRSERGAWLTAMLLFTVGSVLLVLILSGVIGSSSRPPATPPPVLAVAPTPLAGAREQAAFERLHEQTGTSHRSGAVIVTKPSSLQQHLDKTLFSDQTIVHISRNWMGGFYPIYGEAQRVFGVNWLLLASIHRQESAFSTAPGIYHGLNFAGCCGGPMQFNVTNGPVSTWQEVSDSYIYGKRPAVYDHQTAKHPSIYDDFDAIMAAAHLLSVDGDGYNLDGSAWDAAYDYYGHDATGVTYADEVLARAIGWSQHGFCINCGVENGLLTAVYDAYGAPVLAALQATGVKAVAASAKRRSR